MPRMNADHGEPDESDRCEVTVRGRTRAELREAAKIVAYKFFGFDPDTAELVVERFTARPTMYGFDNEPLQYEMTTYVKIGTVDTSAEGETDDDNAAEYVRRQRNTDPVRVPPRVVSSGRAVGPLGEEEWDDDDLADEDDGEDDGD